MISAYRKYRKFKSDEEGMALLEFALIAPVFLFMLMGMFDVGYSMYLRAALDGAVQQAGRSSSLENGESSQDAIDLKLIKSIRAIAPNAKVVEQSRRSYNKFRINEPFTDDNQDGICNDGEPFIDENSNGEWDEDGGSDGFGGPKDIVIYTVKIQYRDLLPLNGLASKKVPLSQVSTLRTLTARTVIKNQPFGAQSPVSNDNLVCS